MGWIDIALLSVLAVSVLLGLARGFTFEVLSLVGWVVAYFAALWFSPALAPHIPLGGPGSALNQGVAFFAAFVLALLLWGLGARLLSLLIKSSPLSVLDRLLGACFGLLRGLVLLLAVATLMALTPWARSAAWQASQGAMWLNGLLRELAPVLPPEWSRRLPRELTAGAAKHASAARSGAL